jgi:quercetin dioxygenase-like cupin family protein
MSGFIRRVVVGHDPQGKAVVLSDGIAPHLKTNPLRPGHRSTDIWKTSSTPVIIKAAEDDPTVQGPRTIHPPKGGTVLRIAELQPESEEIRNLSPEKAREVFAAAGNANAAQFGKGGRHPMMHRTESLDYAVVLEGEITLVLDDEDVLLKAGDVVIQRGNSHAWSNRSDKVCRMLYVLIDGKFDEQLEGWFGKDGDGH